MSLEQVLIKQDNYDFHQMGGDVILDDHNNILYLYHSKTSVDRPSAADLLKLLP